MAKKRSSLSWLSLRKFLFSYAATMHVFLYKIAMIIFTGDDDCWKKYHVVYQRCLRCKFSVSLPKVIFPCYLSSFSSTIPSDQILRFSLKKICFSWFLFLFQRSRSWIPWFFGETYIKQLIFKLGYPITKVNSYVKPCIVLDRSMHLR